MIDIHCHILWNIDDGPVDFDGSLAMARLAAKDGTRQLVATPHIHDTQQSLEIITDKVARLNLALRDENIDLEVLCGGDNLYNLGAENLARFSINGTRYSLMEFPHSHLPANADDAIFEALNHGLVPIITHPERNPSIARNPKLIFSMIESGALVQLTAASLTGGFGPAARACSRYLLKQKRVHFLASDGHSVENRPPLLSAGLKAAAKIIGKDAARKLVFENPYKIVRGHDL